MEGVGGMWSNGERALLPHLSLPLSCYSTNNREELGEGLEGAPGSFLFHGIQNISFCGISFLLFFLLVCFIFSFPATS